MKKFIKFEDLIRNTKYIIYSGMSTMIHHIQTKNNLLMNQNKNKNKFSKFRKQPKHLHDQLNKFLSEYFPNTNNNKLIKSLDNVSIIKTTRTMEVVRNLEKQIFAEEVKINELQTEKREKISKVFISYYLVYFTQLENISNIV
jgi:hypothetical protein